VLPTLLAALLSLVSATIAPAQAPHDDLPELRSLLDRFLAAADDPVMHQRFWDDALVYTSSSGARFGKADILAGMQAAPAGEPSVRYRAEDVHVMNFGDLAVVAFRLVGETAGTEETPASVDEYFNTGTFRRTGDTWRAIAWQATRIPGDA
jgi:ketosteroid isomerase-like protein